MCLVVLGISGRLPGSWPVQVRLAVQVSVGGAVYAGVILCFFRGQVLRYVNFLLSLRKTKEMPGPAVPEDHCPKVNQVQSSDENRSHAPASSRG